jgi:hypothetical protein
MILEVVIVTAAVLLCPIPAKYAIRNKRNHYAGIRTCAYGTYADSTLEQTLPALMYGRGKTVLSILINVFSIRKQRQKILRMEAIRTRRGFKDSLQNVAAQPEFEGYSQQKLAKLMAEEDTYAKYWLAKNRKRIEATIASVRNEFIDA